MTERERFIKEWNKGIPAYEQRANLQWFDSQMSMLKPGGVLVTSNGIYTKKEIQ